MRGSHLVFFFSCFTLGQCFPMFFLLTVAHCTFPSSGFPLLGQCQCQKSGISFHFASSFFCCCSLFNTVKATSTHWEGFIPNASSNLCNFLLISEALCPPKVQAYHSNIFRGLGICISIMSVGLINLFQTFSPKFWKGLHLVFCWFSWILLKLFAFVPLFRETFSGKALPRCTNKQCPNKGVPPSLGSQFGSAVGTA